MAKTQTLTPRIATPPLSLRESPRVFQTIRDGWRRVGRDGAMSTALSQLEHLPIDESEIPVFVASALAALSHPATDRDVKEALTVLQAGLKWPGPEVIHNKAAYLVA